MSFSERLNFRDENPAQSNAGHDFSREIFRERNFGEALLVYNFVPIKAWAGGRNSVLW